MEGASYLMDRPPGGWGDLVTNQSLDQRLAELEARLDAKFDAKLDTKLSARFETFEYKLMGAMDREFRAQTWRLTTAAFSMMTVLVAVMVAAVKL